MKILPILIIMLVLVSPVSATIDITAEPLGATWRSFDYQTDFTYDASTNGEGIQRFGADLTTGTILDFTIWYGDGSTVSGSMEFTHDDALCAVGPLDVNAYCQHSEVSLGGTNAERNFIGLQEIGRFDIVGYAKNTDTNETGLLVYDSVAGISDRQVEVFYPVSGAVTMYKIHVTTNQPIKMGLFTNKRSNIEKAAHTTIWEAIDEWKAYLLAFLDSAKNFISDVFYWTKFFFVDNIGLIVTLYISGSMAITAYNVRGNPVKFIPRFLKDQKALFEFIINLWRTIIESIGTVRGWFRV